ncbi:MBL fold metallo-hydrolase [Pseudonocardia lacus]|uniref:MBL fold metallo-hydrolase n=1 Tax=Pseudonocardia lacus TaxID=2835865 RepID=UPI001BDC41AE|nr:MBL fold metallo-hydrolase [Pseudonocardia lacus]
MHCSRHSLGGVIDDDAPDRDWTEPGIYRCAPGVYRIPLPLPQDGLRAVNVYAIADEAGWTLVDAGWAIAEARELLGAALARLDAGFADIRRFLVTHIHRDHYTQAVALRREFGMKVALGRGEQPGLEAIHSPANAGLVRDDVLHRAGAGELVARRSGPPPKHRRDEWEFPDEWIEDGAEILVGDPDAPRRLRAVQTPGHTQGHVVFADEAAELLFAGDHVLPTITPSIGLQPVRAASPLADFLASLELVRSRPDALLLPAHGATGMRVHQRVDELLAHHAKRLDATLTAVQAGCSTAYEVAGALTWTRRDHRLVDLDMFNTMLATTETLAHLDVLAERGLLTAAEDERGVARYTA